MPTTSLIPQQLIRFVILLIFGTNLLQHHQNFFSHQEIIASTLEAWENNGAAPSFTTTTTTDRIQTQSQQQQQQQQQSSSSPSTTTTTATTSPSSTSFDPTLLFTQDITPQPIQTDPSQHAIIIPYRDRQFHLDKFIEYMDPYLANHFPNATFSLWIVEQDDTNLFNRAWLANVGLKEILRLAPQTKCVILHDVDLIPNSTEVRAPYTTCTYPTQIGRSLQTWNWTIPYPTYCGGITTMSLKHWQVVNGLSNDYIGWGGEDDDLYHRLRINGLLYQSSPTTVPSQMLDQLSPEQKAGAPKMVYTPLPRRPRKLNGAFKAISQNAQHHVQVKKHSGASNIRSLLSLMLQNSGRWKHDGLNDVYYTITKQQQQQQPKRGSGGSGGGFQTIHHIWAIPEKSFDNKRSKVVAEQGRGGGGEDLSKVNKDNSNPQDPPQQPILELVPIPYNGADNALTTAAAKAGIVWGACHYLQNTTTTSSHHQGNNNNNNNPTIMDDNNELVGLECPPNISGDFQFTARFEATYTQGQKPWLLPSYHFASTSTTTSSLYGKNPLEGTHRFSVVRNPYDRAIAMYRILYEKFNTPPPPPPLPTTTTTTTAPQQQQQVQSIIANNHKKRENPERMNAFLQSIFRGGERSELMLPQAEYVFLKEAGKKNQTNRYVHNVLRYEHLMDDLSKMMQRGGYKYVKEAIDWNALGLWWIRDQHNHHDNHESTKAATTGTNTERLGQQRHQLGVEDLTDATIAMLNEVFEQDFIQFGYPKISVKTRTTTATPKKRRTRKKKTGSSSSRTTPRLAALQLLDIPYTGGEVLATTASRAGVVWGACHFTSSPDLCPRATKRTKYSLIVRGDLANQWKFRSDPHQAKKPWLLPPSQFIPPLFRGNQTFAIVRNPYERAIAFYRDMYDTLQPNRSFNGGDNSTVEEDHLLMDREDPKKLNRFLQNILVQFHHPHEIDLATPPPLQVEYAKSASHVIRYESLRSDLKKLLSMYNMTDDILNELQPFEEVEDNLLQQKRDSPPVQRHSSSRLQISDLDDITIDMLNRRYNLDFQSLYQNDKIHVNVTTNSDQYWRRGQYIPKPLLQRATGKSGKIWMSKVKAMGVVLTNSTTSATSTNSASKKKTKVYKQLRREGRKIITREKTEEEGPNKKVLKRVTRTSTGNKVKVQLNKGKDSEHQAIQRRHMPTSTQKRTREPIKEKRKVALIRQGEDLLKQLHEIKTKRKLRQTARNTARRI